MYINLNLCMLFARLQRSVSVSSASVLRQRLLSDDEGVTLVRLLSEMMRRAYDSHITMKSERMADTLLHGMTIIIALLF